jgi:hypothetical protein
VRSVTAWPVAGSATTAVAAARHGIGRIVDTLSDQLLCED